MARIFLSPNERYRRVDACRRKRKLSWRAMGKKLGRNPQSLQRSIQAPDMSVRSLMQVCRVLDVSPTFILQRSYKADIENSRTS